MIVHIQPEGSLLIDARHCVLQELAKSLLVHRVATHSNSPFSACVFLCLQLETVNKHQRQLMLPQITNKRLTPPPQNSLTKTISLQIDAKPQQPITREMPQRLGRGNGGRGEKRKGERASEQASQASILKVKGYVLPSDDNASFSEQSFL